jgi:hypothetical protein
VLPLSAALAIVAVLTLTAPDLEAPARDWVRVAVGEQGVLRDKAVTVTSVRTTQALELRDTAVRSSGRFVVVGAEAAALTGPVTFARVRLQTDDGRRYDPRSEWIEAEPPLVQAGFTVRGSWVFEIPGDRLDGARLLVENEPGEFDGYDRGLRIDLDLERLPPEPGALRLDPASSAVTR